MLKPFDIEPRKDILKKSFVSEEEYSCEEEINLTPQDRIGNIDWCKCGCECKKMVISAESFFLLLWLNHGVQVEHLTIQLLWVTTRLLVTRISFIYLVDEFFLLLVLQNETRRLGESKVLSF